MKKIITLYIVLAAALCSCGNSGDTGRAGSPDNRMVAGASGVMDWPPSSITQEVEVELKKTGSKNYYIIFDGSGSMEGEKLEIAKKAFVQFIKSVPDSANIGLVSFDASGFYERSPLGSSKKEIIDKVIMIKAGGNTPLGGCIRLAYEKLGMQAKKQLGYGEYNLIILTDGQATDGSLIDSAVRMVLDETPIVIHTIGLKIGTGHALNQPGRIYYKAAENLKDISSGLESVLAETEDFTVMDFSHAGH